MKWAEISVGCETCHGQGSADVAGAGENPSLRRDGKADDAKGLIVRFDERQDADWTIDPSTGNATGGAAPLTLRKEVETCGFCHARRGTIGENWVPGQWLSDTHVVPPLSHGLYFADWADGRRGLQLRLVQGKQDVRQRRHLQRLPRPPQRKLPGDAVCLQCHAADKYSVAAHSQHEDVNPPVGCPSCHMPTRTYMIVDPRHDHSIRVPRPDISVKLGTPNACNDCHADKTAQWAADAIQSWHGPERKGFQHYAQAFHDAWADRADAEALLIAAASDSQTPGFACAGALAGLTPYLSPSNVGIAKSSLADPDPMVRIGALDMLEEPSRGDLAARRAVAQRSGSWCARPGRRSSCGGSGGQPTGRRSSVFDRATASSSLRSNSTPIVRKRG